MNKKVRDVIFLAAALGVALAVLIAAVFIADAAAPAPLPFRAAVDRSGATVNAPSVADVTGCHTLAPVSHTADEYVVPGPANIKNTFDKVARRGTYQFLITNLEPTDPGFDKQAEALEWLKGSDDNWHLTLFLPPVLSACNVYVRARLAASGGTIADYLYNEYTTSTLYASAAHSDGTEPLFIDLTLFAEKKVLAPAAPVANGVYVTVHYESTNENFAGIDGRVLVGEDSAVRAAVAGDRLSVAVAAICAVVVLAVLLFVSALKRRLDFLPQLLFTLGIFGVMLCGYLFAGICAAPFFVKALRALSYGIILLGGATAAARRYGRLPLRFPLAALAAAACVLAFLTPLCGAGAYAALSVLTKAAGGALLVLVPAAAVLSAAAGAKKEFCLGALVCPALTGYALFADAAVTALSPVFILCVCLLAVTVFISFREFVLTEKRYAFLTANLQAEVARQTAGLERVVAERDKLLRYLSHDLKKPVTGIRHFLAALQNAENDGARDSALANIERKIGSVEESLAEIQKFAKTNFAAEQPAVLRLDYVLRSVADDLGPDCEANGIRLRCRPARLLVFAKPAALTSVLHNLVFNAIDHADCRQITLAAAREKDCCLITVADDGKGIDAAQQLFVPYLTQRDTDDNLGLGLYICKQFVLSMGGDLTYARNDGNTVFTVKLPLA